MEGLKLGDSVIIFFRGKYRCKGFINVLLCDNKDSEVHLFGLNVDKEVLFYVNKHVVLETRMVLFEKSKHKTTNRLYM
jgi:hypothetical protein